MDNDIHIMIVTMKILRTVNIKRFFFIDFPLSAIYLCLMTTSGRVCEPTRALLTVRPFQVIAVISIGFVIVSTAALILSTIPAFQVSPSTLPPLPSY